MASGFGAFDGLEYVGAVTPAVVPEPSSLLLFGTGAAAVVVAIRRRRKQQVQ
jgi:hypothetical protein